MSDDHQPDAHRAAKRAEDLVSRKKWFWTRALIGTGILVAALIFVLLRTHEEPVSLVGLSWQRSVAIEAWRTVHEEDWNVPAEGRITGEHRAIHHYDKVLDGYRDVSRQVQTGTRKVNCGKRNLGNGYFEDVTCDQPVYSMVIDKQPVYRDEPVYQTKYAYDIERWVPARTDRARSRSAAVLARTQLGFERTIGGPQREILCDLPR